MGQKIAFVVGLALLLVAGYLIAVLVPPVHGESEPTTVIVRKEIAPSTYDLEQTVSGVGTGGLTGTGYP